MSDSYTPTIWIHFVASWGYAYNSVEFDFGQFECIFFDDVVWC